MERWSGSPQVPRVHPVGLTHLEALHTVERGVELRHDVTRVVETDGRGGVLRDGIRVARGAVVARRVHHAAPRQPKRGAEAEPPRLAEGVELEVPPRQRVLRRHDDAAGDPGWGQVQASRPAAGEGARAGGSHPWILLAPEAPLRRAIHALHQVEAVGPFPDADARGAVGADAHAVGHGSPTQRVGRAIPPAHSCVAPKGIPRGLRTTQHRC